MISRTITDPGGLLSACFHRSDVIWSSRALDRFLGHVYSYCRPISAVLPIGKKNTCGSRQAVQVFVMIADMAAKIVRRRDDRQSELSVSNDLVTAPNNGRNVPCFL
jgi:hypothetical protein